MVHLITELHFSMLLIWQLSSSCSLGRPARSVSRDARSHWHISPEKLAAWTVKHGAFIRRHAERLFAFSYPNSTGTFIISPAATPTKYMRAIISISAKKQRKALCIDSHNISYFFVVFKRSHVSVCKLTQLCELFLLDGKQINWASSK